ncbi:MAG: DUF4199 domain-containing protein [Saprospiraceae bacterium]|nr:DUF4199 domain-containing protein [Saprospiraceae bacterium]
MAILDNPQEDLNTAEVSFMPTAQKWGLYLAAATVILTILISIVGFDFSSMKSMAIYGVVAGLSGLATIIVCGVAVIREHRTNLGGFIDFKQAFLVCFVAFLIGTVISSGFNFVYNTYINPSFMDGMRESMNNMFDEANVPEVARADAFKSIDDARTISGTFMTFLKSTVFMAIMAAIMAGIMKKARPMFG